MKIHHLGFLSKNMEKTVRSFKDLGMIELLNVEDDLRQVNLTFLSSCTGEIIEVISPSGKNSVVAKLTNKFSNSVYHICFESLDIEGDIRELEKKDFILLVPPESAIAFNNNRVAFLFNEYSGIVELVENIYESSLFK